MHACDTKDAEKDEAEVSHDEAGVFNGVRHCQDSSSNVPFKQVNDCITVSENNEKR